MNLFLIKKTMIASIALSTLLLTACGGADRADTTTSSGAQPTVAADIAFDKSNVPPSLAVYGLGDSTFVSAKDAVTIRGGSNSLAGKKITLTPQLNGKALDNVALDAQGLYEFNAKLALGDNRFSLTAQDEDGLVTNKEFVIAYIPEATISKDFKLDVKSMAAGENKTLTAEMAFSDVSRIQKVEILSSQAEGAVGVMKDASPLAAESLSDRVYKGNVNVVANGQNAQCFKAQVTLTTGQKYVSSSSCVDVYTKKSNTDYEISSAARNMVVAKFNKLKNSNLPRVEKAKKVVQEIKSNKKFNDYFESMNIDAEGNIFWVMKSGLVGSLMSATAGTKAVGTVGSNTLYYTSPHDSGHLGFLNTYDNAFKVMGQTGQYTEYPPALNVKDINVFKTLNSAGVVLMVTHAGQSNGSTILSTGYTPPQYVCGQKNQVQSFWGLFEREVTVPVYCSNLEAVKPYLDNCVPGKGCLAGEGSLEDGTSVILVRPRYFEENLKDDFKDSLIFIDGCETMDNTDLRDIFFRRGAAGFMGWKNNILIAYSLKFAKPFYENLAAGKSVNEAIAEAKRVAGVNDGQKNRPGEIAVAYNKGYTDLKMPDFSLKNGGFEAKTLTPWQQKGEVVLLGSGGSLKAYEGSVMAAITTGLEKATTSGSIWQKLRVPASASRLNFYADFWSEEFQAYCGGRVWNSDYLKVSACQTNGTCNTILHKPVYQMCSSVRNVGLNLNIGKPAVYGTGWVQQSVDITAYRGQSIDLKFEIGDSANNTYDSAVLLDNIKFE